MAFCPYCGSEIAESAKFCTQCGARLTQSVPAQEEPAEFVYTEVFRLCRSSLPRRARLRTRKSERKSPKHRWSSELSREFWCWPPCFGG